MPHSTAHNTLFYGDNLHLLNGTFKKAWRIQKKEGSQTELALYIQEKQVK